MNAFTILIRKNLGEARWVLGLSAVLLFALGWLIASNTGRLLNDPVRAERFRVLSEARGQRDFESSIVLQAETFVWSIPPVLLPLLIWAIGRGSLSVAGELERGTLDLVLSRPVTRTTYLASHVAVAIVGLMVIAGGLVGGFMVGNLVHKVPGAPSLYVWARPWANFVALGFAVFGYTLVASSWDVVRWRATTFGACVTVLSGLTQVLANLEVLKPYRRYIENASVFKRYDPLRAAATGEGLGFDLGVLCAVGAVCTVVAFVVFSRRDLPSSAG